jgi:hypothetical protein
VGEILHNQSLNLQAGIFLAFDIIWFHGILKY